MKILLTGASGFLGWHSRIRLAVDGHDVVPVTRRNWSQLSELVADVDVILHIAGVNRGTDMEVEDGNLGLARKVAASLELARKQPLVIFANSVQAERDTPYGRGKRHGSEILAAAATANGLSYVDVVLPNLFGEHGRPRYNSVVATFVDAVITGAQPQIDDRPIDLLHAQDAAEVFVDAIRRNQAGRLTPLGTSTCVSALWTTLQSFHRLYLTGDVPPLTGRLQVDLFNTLRAGLFPDHYPIWPTPRIDQRGSLTELVRSHGGGGQTFVSTTHPGQTRGEHLHLRKLERFVVLSGRGRINLRRMFGSEIVSFDMDGDRLGIVDMPTTWVHNITNTGDSDLTTLFWTDALFDPAAPDTYPALVHELAEVRLRTDYR